LQPIKNIQTGAEMRPFASLSSGKKSALPAKKSSRNFLCCQQKIKTGGEKFTSFSPHLQIENFGTRDGFKHQPVNRIQNTKIENTILWAFSNTPKGRNSRVFLPA
jgi:hypothetical protein